MTIKYVNKKIVDATLTAEEKKAVDIAVSKEISQMNEANSREVDAIVLWIINQKYGFGPVRLKKFHDEFDKELKELSKRYELPDTDQAYLCTRMLKQMGIDIEAWDKELDSHDRSE